MLHRISKRQIKLLSLIVIIIAFLSALLPLFVRELIRDPRITGGLYAWRHGAEYLGEDEVIKQTTPSDCGVACLQMVLRRRGIIAPASDIRALSGTNKHGTSMYGLKKTAEQYGLGASALMLRADEILKAPMPLIAFTDKSHFVVVSYITGDNQLIVLDPAAGKLKHDLRSFKKRWRGEVIIFSEIDPKR